jgi:hypothetical protein
MTSWFEAIPIVGDLLKGIVKVVDDAVPDSDLKAKLESEDNRAKLESGLKEMSQRMQLQQAAIVAEIQGESWLQRNWRPLTMMVFVFIIVNNFVLVPYLTQFWVGMPTLPLPPELWQLLEIGLGGYIAGRTIEKVTETVVEGKKKAVKKGGWWK